jgi:hypothetical protein
MPVLPQQLVDPPDCQENWEWASSRVFDTGDIKTSIRNADHGGWLLMDGRTITASSPLRTLLVGLGSPFGVTGSDPKIPDGKERVLVMAGATHALGAAFGSAGSNMPAHSHVPVGTGPVFGNPLNICMWENGTQTALGTGALRNPFATATSTLTTEGSGSATDGNYPLSVTVNYFIHT